MADLVFTTRGQAEALAAQERLARVARDTKLEFEAGAKATQAWDSAQQSLKRSAEASLRAVTTEQEKITQQIENIKAAYREGLILKPEAEQGVQRLRQRWVDVDTAIKGSQKTLGTVPAEINKIEKPTNRVAATFEKAWDPIKLAKFAASFVSVGTAINVLRKEFTSLQEEIDKVTERQLKAAEQLAKAEGAAGVSAADRDRLATRKEFSETLDQSMVDLSVAQRTDRLKAEEVAKINEMLDMAKGTAIEKTIGSYTRGSMTAEEARGYLEKELKWRTIKQEQANIMRAEGFAPTGRGLQEFNQFTRENDKLIEIMKKQVELLERIEAKEGGVMVGGS